MINLLIHLINRSTMAETSDQCVYINSLVTLNISDHWTRVRVQDGLQRVFKI